MWSQPWRPDHKIEERGQHVNLKLGRRTGLSPSGDNLVCIGLHRGRGENVLARSAPLQRVTATREELGTHEFLSVIRLQTSITRERGVGLWTRAKASAVCRPSLVEIT